MRGCAAAFLMLVLPACVACQGGRREQARRFDLVGTVVSVERERREVTIAHGEIPGFMPAMTMAFSVRDSWALSILSRGQAVRATLVVDGRESWLEQISVTEPTGGGADSALAGDAVDPVPGVEVPEFYFVNQDGKPVRTRQYGGQALLLTFIYTRCPLPEYCPRMNRNFSEINAAIAADPDLRARARLLSVSFDPGFDKPEVLRPYGIGYARLGSEDPFRYWEFASGSAEETQRCARFFGLSYWKDSGQIIHSLRTALISPDGRLTRLYRGNEWTPAQVIAELKRMISQPKGSRPPS